MPLPQFLRRPPLFIFDGLSVGLPCEYGSPHRLKLELMFQCFSTGLVDRAKLAYSFDFFLILPEIALPSVAP